MNETLKSAANFAGNLVTLLPIFWATNLHFPERKRSDISVKTLSYEPKLVKTPDGDRLTEAYTYDQKDKTFVVSPNALVQFHGGNIYWLIHDFGSWASISAGENPPEQDKETKEWSIPKARAITTLRYDRQKEWLAGAQISLKLREVRYKPPGWFAWRNGG